jgi:hypothetical protein
VPDLACARANLNGATLTGTDLTDARWPEGELVPEGWRLDTANRVHAWSRNAPLLLARVALPMIGAVPRAGHHDRSERSDKELLAWLSAAGPLRTFTSRSSTSAHVLLHSASGPRICSRTASCSSNEDS